MSNAAAATKILSTDALGEVRDELAHDGKVVVHCHGCFDIVHPGHIRYLRFAKSLGDVLFVTVSADDVVAKGFERPFIPEDLRLDNLAELQCVDYVALSEDDWAGPVLERLRPDIYVKGREYESNDDPRFAREKALVEKNGGKVVLGSGDVIFSSTEIGQRKRHSLGMEQRKIESFCRRHDVTAAGIKNLVAAFADLHVIVLGDAILDHYAHCEDARVASESPIVAVKPIDEDWYVGGAGLIARQLASLGAKATLITCCEEDGDYFRFEVSLGQSGVDVINLPVRGRKVFTKTRYLVGGQKVFKVDRGNPAPISIELAEQLNTMVRDSLGAHDGLILTDFGYGLFGKTVCEGVAKAAEASGKPYFADVSTNGRANILKFHGPRLTTPTEAELRFALGDAESGLSNLAIRYYAATSARGLVVTLGRSGSLFFNPPAEGDGLLKTDYLPALEVNEVDAVGAGDVFLSGLSLAQMAGASVPTGMYLSSALASVSANNLGNEGASLPDLYHFLDDRLELAGE